jgi:predicted TIM-barrel fold metal-dependent hydrolase
MERRSLALTNPAQRPAHDVTGEQRSKKKLRGITNADVLPVVIHPCRRQAPVIGVWPPGGFLRPNPYHGNKMINHPMYEPFWTMAEELDFAIGFHEGSSSAMPTVGVDRFEADHAARHMISHTMEMMLAALSVIWGGVVDRHPRLRIAFLESGGGWMAPWLDRMDRHFDDQGFNDTAPKMRPSELFQRNCWISFEPVENSIAVLADYIRA